MKRIIMMTTAAAVFAGMAASAHASNRSSNTAYEQRIKLKTEWKQSQHAGGYGNPLTALVSFLSGEDTGNAIQPVINDPHSRGVTIYSGSTSKKAN